MPTKKNIAHSKPTQKKRKPGKHTAKKKLRWQKLWPPLVGAAIVVATSWLLFRWYMSTRATPTAVPPPGYTVHGIDISHHQGDIDWELLRNRATIDTLPVSFVFIKATEGSDIVDSRFKRNFDAARCYGIMRGAYHFYRTSTSSKLQAEHFIRHVKLESGDLPPVLDVEVKPSDVSAEKFRQGILEWLVRVEQHYKVKPILYTYHSFRQQFMNDSVFNLYPYWIAHYYVDSLHYRGPWAFWQHSDIGQLPGIKEKVDLNIFNGSYEELRAMTIE
ncbi:MAG: glycoside hydrolase family 25 protein [Prevotella sp.]|nr:glycoside hydrolase family 25 protein [Prevotella sp.]